MSDPPEPATVRWGLDVATTGDWSDPRSLIELAVDAEVHGWDGFFLWDILLPDDEYDGVADPWTTLGAIAAATRRIRLGAMVTPLPRRQPWDVAKALATLDRLSEGRMVFGAGLGWHDDELRRLGLPTSMAGRAEALDEGLDVITRLWTGRPVTMAGRHHRLVGVRTLPTPLQRPRIPVWTAAGWPRRAPLRRAVRWDGVYLMTEHQVRHDRLTPDDVREVAAIAAAERGDAPFDIAVNVSTPDEPDGGHALALGLADAGATWLIELTPEMLDEHRDLIRRGPLALARG